MRVNDVAAPDGPEAEPLVEPLGVALVVGLDERLARRRRPCASASARATSAPPSPPLRRSGQAEHELDLGGVAARPRTPRTRRARRRRSAIARARPAAARRRASSIAQNSGGSSQIASPFHASAQRPARLEAPPRAARRRAAPRGRRRAARATGTRAARPRQPSASKLGPARARRRPSSSTSTRRWASPASAELAPRRPARRPPSPGSRALDAHEVVLVVGRHVGRAHDRPVRPRLDPVADGGVVAVAPGDRVLACALTPPPARAGGGPRAARSRAARRAPRAPAVGVRGDEHRVVALGPRGVQHRRDRPRWRARARGPPASCRRPRASRRGRRRAAARTRPGGPARRRRTRAWASRRTGAGRPRARLAEPLVVRRPRLRARATPRAARGPGRTGPPRRARAASGGGAAPSRPSSSMPSVVPAARRSSPPAARRAASSSTTTDGRHSPVLVDQRLDRVGGEVAVRRRARSGAGRAASDGVRDHASRRRAARPRSAAALEDARVERAARAPRAGVSRRRPRRRRRGGSRSDPPRS